MALKSQGSIATSWQSQNKGGSVAAATSAAEKQRKTQDTQEIGKVKEIAGAHFESIVIDTQGHGTEKIIAAKKKRTQQQAKKEAGNQKKRKHILSKSALPTCLPISKEKANKKTDHSDQKNQKEEKKIAGLHLRASAR